MGFLHQIPAKAASSASAMISSRVFSRGVALISSRENSSAAASSDLGPFVSVFCDTTISGAASENSSGTLTGSSSILVRSPFAAKTASMNCGSRRRRWSVSLQACCWLSSVCQSKERKEKPRRPSRPHHPRYGWREGSYRCHSSDRRRYPGHCKPSA